MLALVSLGPSLRLGLGSSNLQTQGPTLADNHPWPALLSDQEPSTELNCPSAKWPCSDSNDSEWLGSLSKTFKGKMKCRFSGHDALSVTQGDLQDRAYVVAFPLPFPSTVSLPWNPWLIGSFYSFLSTGNHLEAAYPDLQWAGWYFLSIPVLGLWPGGKWQLLGKTFPGACKGLSKSFHLFALLHARCHLASINLPWCDCAAKGVRFSVVAPFWIWTLGSHCSHGTCSPSLICHIGATLPDPSSTEWGTLYLIDCCHDGRNYLFRNIVASVVCLTEVTEEFVLSRVSNV